MPELHATTLPVARYGRKRMKRAKDTGVLVVMHGRSRMTIDPRSVQRIWGGFDAWVKIASDHPQR